MTTTWPLWAGVVVLAALLGVATPFYVNALGDSPAKLMALPAALVLLFALFFSRVSLLMMLMLSRATCETIFELSRFPIAGVEIGIGGLINGVAIVIVAMLVMEKPERFTKEIVIVWGAFLVFVVAGAAISPDRGAAIRFALQLLSDFAVFIGGCYVVRSFKDYRLCVFIIIASSVLPALYGLYEHFGGFANFYEDAGFRVRSTFGHPNVFAFYLTIVISLTFYALKSSLFEAPRKLKVIGVLYLAVLIFLLLMTKTRSAWIATAIVFVGYGALFERRYLVYLVLGAFVALLIPGVGDRLVDLQSTGPAITSAQQNSFEWRLTLWREALSYMAPARFLTGYGLMSFPYFTPQYFSQGEGFNWSAHSVFVQLIFEQGIIGLIAFLWIFARLAWRFFAFRITDRLGVYILLVIVAEYLVECYSDNMLDYLSFNWYVWFLFGAALRVALAPASASKPAVTPGVAI